ncbi:hypothetical protein O181_044298 [Austropuccinia psidii MF-1]|uniref:Uncharacterized protein n=1 Tax=Austropuccinia psidii MF-1 TaxID=1389203 RepID=A0A9Q3DPU0_9BASI|nr:hypothetical protein [Austropuccinia psidii MF-1]
MHAVRLFIVASFLIIKLPQTLAPELPIGVLPEAGDVTLNQLPSASERLYKDDTQLVGMPLGAYNAAHKKYSGFHLTVYGFSPVALNQGCKNIQANILNLRSRLTRGGSLPEESSEKLVSTLEKFLVFIQNLRDEKVENWKSFLFEHEKNKSLHQTSTVDSASLFVNKAPRTSEIFVRNSLQEKLYISNKGRLGENVKNIDPLRPTPSFSTGKRKTSMRGEAIVQNRPPPAKKARLEGGLRTNTLDDTLPLVISDLIKEKVFNLRDFLEDVRKFLENLSTLKIELEANSPDQLITRLASEAIVYQALSYLKNFGLITSDDFVNFHRNDKRLMSILELSENCPYGVPFHKIYSHNRKKLKTWRDGSNQVKKRQMIYESMRISYFQWHLLLTHRYHQSTEQDFIERFFTQPGLVTRMLKAPANPEAEKDQNTEHIVTLIKLCEREASLSQNHDDWAGRRRELHAAPYYLGMEELHPVYFEVLFFLVAFEKHWKHVVRFHTRFRPSVFNEKLPLIALLREDNKYRPWIRKSRNRMRK